MLLTNGGGKHETERVADISEKLKVPLDESVIVQSHTPFAELVHEPDTKLKDKCVLVVGGEGGNCRKVAERYRPLPRYRLVMNMNSVVLIGIDQVWIQKCSHSG